MGSVPSKPGAWGWMWGLGGGGSSPPRVAQNSLSFLETPQPATLFALPNPVAKKNKYTNLIKGEFATFSDQRLSVLRSHQQPTFMVGVWVQAPRSVLLQGHCAGPLEGSAGRGLLPAPHIWETKAPPTLGSPLVRDPTETGPRVGQRGELILDFVSCLPK